MARRVFFSFHYKPDNSRAAQVRNMGMVEPSRLVAHMLIAVARKPL